MGYKCRCQYDLGSHYFVQIDSIYLFGDDYDDEADDDDEDKDYGDDGDDADDADGDDGDDEDDGAELGQ